MSQKKVKQMRRQIRKYQGSQYNKFANELMEMKFILRLKIAWKILKGKKRKKIAK